MEMFRHSFIPCCCLNITVTLSLIGSSGARYGAPIDKTPRDYTVVRHVQFEDKGGWVFFGATSVNSVSFEPEPRDAMQNARGETKLSKSL